MKSRSHRLPVDQKDDWVEESWTVDCLCGVNFDDGEEMVDCDDCGVWVHTRCSRYVKTDSSFVCDKCKNNDSSEETEVAQLLVELPTKTVRRMDSAPLPSPPCTTSSVLTASTRPFKVHVQGVPGDPSLFSGISAAFGPQLWKCSGYIPKKFNFKYREFPCEDEEVLDNKNSALKIETQTDISSGNGAGALLSLSKLDVSFPTPVGVEKQPDDGKGSHKFVSPKQSGRLDNLNSDPLTLKNEVGKNTSFMKPPLLHFEKRKREDLPNAMDRSGKKKARLFVKDGDCSERIRLRSPDRGHMAAEIDPRCGRVENASYSLPTSHLSHDPVVVDHAIDAQKSNSRERNRQQHPLKLEGFSKTTIGASSTLTSGLVPAEEEVTSITAVTPDVLGGKLFGSGGTGMQQAEQVQEDSAASVSKTDEGGSAPDSSINTATSFRGIHAKSKIKLASGIRNVNVKMSSLYGTKLSSSGTSFASQDSSEIASVSDAAVTGSVTRDSKVEEDVRRSEVDLHKQRADGESPLHHCKPGHEGGFDGFLESKKFSPSAAVEHDKCIVTASAASSVVASSAIVILKSSASEISNMSATGQSDNVAGKQNLVRDSSLNGASTVVVEDEVRHENARKLIKEHSKSALSCVPKSSQLKKISHAAIVSKKTIHDLKDSALDSSSSPTRVAPHVASHPTSELANEQHTESPLKLQKMISTSQHESASNLQKKVTGSLLSHKGEKINQSLLQTSSKVSNALSHAAAPSNSPSTLSDEELALLLHQELNSSPRVPRVPRMRHAGSLPQLASPTAASGLMKRTSSTGAKDHVLAFSRRKTKDLAKDAGQSFGEMDDEGKKMDRVSSPKDLRKQDSAFISDSVSKREADSGSANSLNSIKKSRRAAIGSLSATAEGNECSFSSSRLSPKIPSDEEKGGGAPVTHRTLPSLLAEIMSEGKRMTYEELCNSVLPHWPYLRKHNGERYAYSSHSQAVLDCLRNRNEWARLVDRGPKTSGGRKRRKVDAGVESEDNDDDTAKVGSRSRRVEEFPKGKRKARKRKRLDLPKDVRRRQKADGMSDEKYGSLSDSSEETSLSEGEMQGSGISAGGNSGGT